MSRYLTVREFASIMRRHPRTIYRWIEEDTIQEAVKVKGKYLIPEEEVQRILKEFKAKQMARWGS